MCSLDGSSLAAAKLLANSGFQGAYAIKGGVEAWQVNSDDESFLGFLFCVAM